MYPTDSKAEKGSQEMLSCFTDRKEIHKWLSENWRERWPPHKDSTVKREKYASKGQAGEQSPTVYLTVVLHSSTLSLARKLFTYACFPKALA